MTRPPAATLTLIGACVALAAGASGQILDRLPGGCAEGIGCIFSMGMISAMLALPVTLLLGCVTLILTPLLLRAGGSPRIVNAHVAGAIIVMLGGFVVVALAWFLPY